MKESRFAAAPIIVHHRHTCGVGQEELIPIRTRFCGIKVCICGDSAGARVIDSGRGRRYRFWLCNLEGSDTLR